MKERKSMKSPWIDGWFFHPSATFSDHVVALPVFFFCFLLFLWQKSRRCSCSSPGNPVASSSKGQKKKEKKNLREWVSRAGCSRAARSSRWRGNKQVRLPWTERAPSKTNIPGGPLSGGGALSACVQRLQGPTPQAVGLVEPLHRHKVDNDVPLSSLIFPDWL